MKFFNRNPKQEQRVGVPNYEARETASTFPKDIQRFLAEQLTDILEQVVYPEYSLFEKLHNDQEFAQVFFLAHNEIVVSLRNNSLDRPEIMGVIGKLGRWGVKPEQIVDILIAGSYLNRIDKASVIWVCMDCRRVLGLLDEVPGDLLSKYPILSDWQILTGYFGLYVVGEKIVCPHCSSTNWMTLNRNFLLSGLSLQSKIDEARRLKETAR
jgi:hypothetical protein